MSRVKENYCTECEWSVSSAEHTVHERTQLAIDHAVTTGHDIDYVSSTEATPNDVFAADSPKQSIN